MIASRYVKPALAGAIVLLLLYAGRQDTSSATSQSAAVSPPKAAVASALASPVATAQVAVLAPGGEHEAASPATPKSAAECQQKIDETLARPKAEGTPELDAGRSRLLLFAKAEPVLFVEQPAVNERVTKSTRVYRSLLRRTSSPWSLLKQLWPTFSANQEFARGVLLRDGYLYAEKPELAFALVDLVSAQLLFSDKQIWIHRGSRVLHAERSRTGHYVFTDGPERGQRVRLLLFDRLGSGETPPPLHRDFRALRQRLNFDRVKIEHLTHQGIVADLRYGSTWVRTLLEPRGADLDVVCELRSAEATPAVAEFRAQRLRKERVLEPLRTAMIAQVEEGLPFDEPKIEYGQQDGQMRRRWLRAYESGRHYYKMNDDRYDVFNTSGQPLVPQVCVDFIFDTFERAGGTWWRERGQPRQRVIGKMDFGTLSDETMRRATSIVDYAASRPEAFDVYLLPEKDRVPFKHGQELANYLTEQADDFQPGDIVLIKGYAPWDKPWRPKIMHVHSFFIYESDPITGFPLSLAGNPGRPVLQTWQFEAFRTPDRSVWYRIRPHVNWLEQVVQVRSDMIGSSFPPTLTNEKRDRSALRDEEAGKPAG